MALDAEALTHRRKLLRGEGGALSMALHGGRPVIYFSGGGMFDDDEGGSDENDLQAFDTLVERERFVLSEPYWARGIARDRPRILWGADFTEELIRSSIARIVDLTDSRMRLPRMGAGGGERKVEAHFQAEAVVPALREGIEAMTLTVERDKVPLEFPSRTIKIEGFRHNGCLPGPVDVLLPRPVNHPLGAAPSGLELKWCWEPTTFGNCLWDLLKLGTAMTERGLECAYLLVGGATDAFRVDAPGNEPFREPEGGSWEISASELLSASGYEPWWRKWRAEVTPRPRFVPNAVRTTLMIRQPAGDLTVALARVEVADNRRRIVGSNGEVEGLSR